MTKRPLPFDKALDLARRVVGLFSPACDRLEIAGSIRRGKSTVGDLELVAIPHVGRDLFNDKAGSWLDALLADLEAEGRLQRIKGGDRYKQFHITKANFTLDLFIVEPLTWGVQYMIRTGPADFSRRMVTERRAGGLMPDNWRVKEGRVWSEFGDHVSTPEEIDVFEAYGMDFIEPRDRR